MRFIFIGGADCLVGNGWGALDIDIVGTYGGSALEPVSET